MNIEQFAKKFLYRNDSGALCVDVKSFESLEFLVFITKLDQLGGTQKTVVADAIIRAVR